MPRLLNRAPTLRRHATGQGIVTFGGRDHYCGRYGSPPCREQYRRLIQEWLSSGCTTGPRHPSEPVLIKHVIAGYWRHAKTYYRRPDGTPTSTLTSVKTALRCLRSSYGSLPATEFGPLRLKTLRDEWIRSGRTRTTCNAYTGLVVRCVRWAAENELVPGECYHALRSVRGLRAGRSEAREGVRIAPADPWIVKKVLRVASPTLAAMIRLQWRTGCRPQEICNLRWDRIERTGRVWIYRPLEHKTAHHGHLREIHLGPKAQRCLNRFLEQVPEATEGFVFDPSRAESVRRERGIQISWKNCFWRSWKRFFRPVCGA